MPGRPDPTGRENEMEMPTVEYERHEMILVSGHHTGAEDRHRPLCLGHMIIS